MSKSQFVNLFRLCSNLEDLRRFSSLTSDSNEILQKPCDWTAIVHTSENTHSDSSFLKLSGLFCFFLIWWGLHPGLRVGVVSVTDVPLNPLIKVDEMLVKSFSI